MENKNDTVLVRALKNQNSHTFTIFTICM